MILYVPAENGLHSFLKKTIKKFAKPLDKPDTKDYNAYNSKGAVGFIPAAPVFILTS